MALMDPEPTPEERLEEDDRAMSDIVTLQDLRERTRIVADLAVERLGALDMYGSSAPGSPVRARSLQAIQRLGTKIREHEMEIASKSDLLLE